MATLRGRLPLVVVRWGGRASSNDSTGSMLMIKVVMSANNDIHFRRRYYSDIA